MIRPQRELLKLGGSCACAVFFDMAFSPAFEELPKSFLLGMILKQLACHSTFTIEIPAALAEKVLKTTQKYVSLQEVQWSVFVDWSCHS